MPAARIAEVVFSDPDTVREVIHNFNRDGFDSLYLRYRGGRPRTFTLPERQQIKRIALSVPTDLGQPFATWSLAKLADYLVAEEVVTDISHERLRQLLREEDVSFQALRSWKRSNDPDFEAKKNRILELYAIADELAEPGPDPSVVVCLDEFGPLNLQPQPGGKAWAPRAKPRRIRATYTRPHGVRHLLCALDVGSDLLSAEVTERKARVEFLAFCTRIRSRYPAETRLAFVLDNFSPHKGDQVRAWAVDNNVELAYTPHYASWLNRIEPQFKGLRYFCLAGTDHPDHETHARLITDYIDWRNAHRDDPKLRHLTRRELARKAAVPADTANVA
jgi:transposase